MRTYLACQADEEKNEVREVNEFPGEIENVHHFIQMFASPFKNAKRIKCNPFNEGDLNFMIVELFTLLTAGKIANKAIDYGFALKQQELLNRQQRELEATKLELQALKETVRLQNQEVTPQQRAAMDKFLEEQA